MMTSLTIKFEKQINYFKNKLELDELIDSANPL